MLKSKIFLKSIIMVMGIIVVYTLAISIVAIPKIDKSIEQLEEKNAIDTLNKISMLTTEVFKNLEQYKIQTIQKHKNELKNLTNTVCSMIKSKYNQSKLQNTPESSAKFKQEVINLVRELRYGDGNYFFIYNYNNIAISHPYIQGKDMTNIRDKKGKLIVPPFIKIAREKGEGFYSYWWKKNKKDDIPVAMIICQFGKSFTNDNFL